MRENKDPQSSEQKENKELALEDIKVEIVRILEGREYQKGEVLEDERGVYIFQAITTDPEDGERMDCVFQRSGNAERPSKDTVIYKIFYIGEDMVGGEPVAKFSEDSGEWDYLD